MQKSILLCILIFMGLALNAQNLEVQQTQNSSLTQVRLLGKTKAVRDLPLASTKASSYGTKKKNKKQLQIPNFSKNTLMPTPFKDLANPQNGDPLYQLFLQKSLTLDIEPGLVFDGMDENDSGITPPDTNGDVSDEYYVQTINGSNTIMSIWDKEGNLIQGSIAFNSLWEEFGITGLGDPVILWDKEAGRWLISEIGTFGTDVMLIAISDTADPQGTWNAYEVQAPGLPDYPKYGIWNNSYVITTNEFSDDFIPVYALDRQAMLDGNDSANALRLGGMTKFGDDGAFQVATPVNFNGTIPPPAGSPHYSVRIYDDAWEGGEDAIQVWETNVDWSNPDAATVENPTIIPISAFDSQLCDSGIFDCIAQGDGTTLSALQQVIMYRANYRNFGSHESIVLNFSVDVDDTNHAGVRWVELRKQGDGDWSLYQEGTIAPDENHRFMGSINMDASGNILVAYSVTGPSAQLALRYTGRLSGDPLGEMTITEYEFAEGLGVYGGGRWGDYASMSIDPSDDRTFWFTGEYMGESIWKTKIINVLLRRDTFDIGVQAITAPTTSGYLTDSESVTVAVRNYGYEPAYEFPVSYSIEGAPFVTEMFNDTIQPDSVKYHTFASIEDLSALGDYQFISYSAWAQDTTFFNDTLRTIVSQLTRNDAAATGVNGTGGETCSDTFEGGVLLLNAGVDTLTSATIEYQINASTPIIINWEGTLASGETDVIPVTSTDVVVGLNTITVTITLPNGVTDEDPTDNSLTREFTMLIDSGINISFELLTDNFPGETSWELENSTGEIIYEENDYNNAQTLHTEEWCIGEGCYTFRIFDSFGDGIQFQGVEGDVSIIRMSDGVVLFDLVEPNFGSELEIEFCTDFECAIDAEAMAVNVSQAGATDGSILVNPTNGNAPFEFSINAGANWQTATSFNNLSAGEYTIEVRDANSCTHSFEIEVGTCTLMISAEVSAAANSNSNDGIINITATGGGDGVEYSLDGNNWVVSNIFENLDGGDYTVYVQNAEGCIQSLDVIVETTVGLQNPFYGVSVAILPNPTDGLFMVEVRGLEELSTLRVDIVDVNGRTLKSDRLVNYGGVLQNRLSLATYPSGTYFLRLRNDAFAQVVRVIKK